MWTSNINTLFLSDTCPCITRLLSSLFCVCLLASQHYSSLLYQIWNNKSLSTSLLGTIMHYKRNNNTTANFLLTLADKKGFISKTIHLKARPINLLEPNIRLVIWFGSASCQSETWWEWLTEVVLAAKQTVDQCLVSIWLYDLLKAEAIEVFLFRRQKKKEVSLFLFFPNWIILAKKPKPKVSYKDLKTQTQSPT